tara:strand:+ start:590 stop:805 length:216 start_codon:yes stop_codon:yes gene_type:complete
LVNLSGKELKMDKNIIVELDESGLVVAVYCPDETYTVDVLDYRDWDNGVDDSMNEYYQDLEKETENLKNRY